MRLLLKYRLYKACLILGCLFNSLLSASESFDPGWKQIEIPENKEVQSSLLKVMESEYLFPLKVKKMEKKGLSYVAFQAMSAKEFAKHYGNEIPGVTDREAFKSGLMVRLTGAFLATNKSDIFFSPEYQLKKEVVETIGRKVYMDKKLSGLQIAARKTIKSNKIRDSWSTGTGPVNSFDLTFNMSAFSWHFHEKPGHQWEGWRPTYGDALDISSLAGLNQHLTDYPGLQLNEIEGVRDPASGKLLRFPDHVVTTFTEPHPDEEIVNGSHFVTSVYSIPGKPWSLVITRWYVSVNQKDMIKRFVGSGLASVVNTFCNIFGPVGVNGFIEHTILRDYARLVDAVRSFRPE